MEFSKRIRAAGIVVHNDNILLNCYKNTFGLPQYYNIIGGGLEKDEQLRNGVMREAT